MKARIGTSIAATLAVLALGAGTASAAPGNGKSGAAPSSRAATASAVVTRGPNTHGKGDSGSRKHEAPPTTTTTGEGVKPSNTTQLDTHAPASSNKTKLYGNGRTAGQIATGSGYGSATLHGPGNSQPHKVLCGRHEVDVHALAHKRNRCEPRTDTTPATTTPTPATTTASTPAGPAPDETPAPAVATSGSSPAAPAVTASGSPPTSGVLGAHHTRTTPRKPRFGVLGTEATRNAVTRRRLPFTGLALWPFLAAGAALIGTGILLRARRGEAG